jgi:tetraacyldisaccharide 4'-kinase
MIENFFKKTIESRTFSSLLIKLFLRLFSFIYFLIISLRKALYLLKIKKSSRAKKAVVISVGNITLGGAGKTPLTLMLAKICEEKGQVAILTRGYRSLSEHKKVPLRMDCHELNPPISAELIGDEPLIFLNHLKKSRIYIGKNRKKSLEMAEVSGADIILLDDGMQHIQVERDFNLVIIDPVTLSKKQHLFPRGFLREPLSALKRADLVIFLSKSLDPWDFLFLEKILKVYTDAPTVYMRMYIDTWVGGSIENEKVALFCAIAEPHSFIQSVALLAKEVVLKKELKDHGCFTPDQFVDFEKISIEKGAKKIVCTEKDRVKFPYNTKIPLIYPQMALKVEKGQQNWESLLAKIAVF